MRILHLGKYFPPYSGGMEVFLGDLVTAQRAQGHEVSVLVHGDREPDDPAWVVRASVLCKFSYAPFSPGFPWAAWRLIREFRPEVIHLHLPNASAFCVLLLRSAATVPWVVHWHSDVVSAGGGRMLSLAYQLYRPFEQALLARATRILVTSPPYLEASEPLSDWHDKTGIVALGLDPARYPELPEAESVFWKPGSYRILALGRLAHYKGFGVLVRAVAGIEGAQLCIAGDGEERAILAAAAAEAGGQVRLLGAVSEVEKNELLASCDVLCLPSIERSEAFGVVLLEAMRYRKPCVVSDLTGSGMPWVVEQGACGTYAAVGNVDDWQRAIRHMRDDPRRAASFGEAGFRALEDRFSIAACSNNVMREYRLAGCAVARPAQSRGLLVVIPARDEAGTVGGLVRKLQESGFNDVVLIDDGSSDNTGETARLEGAIILRAPLAMGAWGAMQAGIRYGLDRGYSEVVTMDADGQHEVSEISALLRAREDGCDVVIGAHPERGSAARRVAWGWFRKLTGFGLEDLTSGFRYYNHRAMQIAASNAATLLDYQDVGVLLLLRRARLRVVEVPVSMNLRAVGRSKIFNSWLTVVRYMAVTTLLCLARLPLPFGISSAKPGKQPSE